MKRSAALAPLSREHHVALVVARALARTEPGQLSANVERFLRFMDEHELGHFAQEESVLLPALADREGGPSLARRVLDDHEHLRVAAEQLRADPKRAELSRVRDIGTLLRAHVQMEERELFPYLEASLSPEALDELGAKLLSGGGA